MSRNNSQAKWTKRHQTRSGQVVTEYLMILTFVVCALASAKIQIGPNNETIMTHLSAAFTVWTQDILIIISLPS
jgi:hypothetical protein